MSYFNFLYRPPSSSLCTLFDFILSNIDEVLSINPSANVFVSGDFNVHHKDRLIYSGETDTPGNSVTISLSQMALFRWLTFLLWFLTVTLKVLLVWNNIFLLTPVFVLHWLFLHWECWSCCCLRYHWLSVKLTMGCPVSSHSLWLFLYWLGRSSLSFERCSIGGYL